MNQDKFIYSAQMQYYFLIKLGKVLPYTLDNFKVTFYHFRIIVFNADGLPIEARINIVCPFRATPKSHKIAQNLRVARVKASSADERQKFIMKYFSIRERIPGKMLAKDSQLYG